MVMGFMQLYCRQYVFEPLLVVLFSIDQVEGATSLIN